MLLPDRSTPLPSTDSLVSRWNFSRTRRLLVHRRAILTSEVSTPHGPLAVRRSPLLMRRLGLWWTLVRKQQGEMGVRPLGDAGDAEHFACKEKET